MLSENGTGGARILETDKLAVSRERAWMGWVTLAGNRTGWDSVKAAATLCRHGCSCAAFFAAMVVCKAGNLKDRGFVITTIQGFSKDHPYLFFS